MKKYVCTVCGYVHEGEEPPEECPICHQPASKFKEETTTQGDGSVKKENTSAEVDDAELEYDKAFYRVDESCRYMEEIHRMAVTGKSVGGSMGTRMAMPDWDDILLLGAQLNPPPLNDHDPVTTMQADILFGNTYNLNNRLQALPANLLS